MNKPVLVVLAAGMGSRYHGLKQIDPMGKYGEKILDYSVYDAIEAGFNEIIFIIRKDIEEDFKKIIGDRIEKICASKGVDVKYCFQDINNIPGEMPVGRTKPWGTGQAILCCKDVVDSPFLVINADDYYGKQAFKEAYDYLTKESVKDEICMVGFVLKNTLSDNGSVTRGVCKVNESNMLVEINETHDIEKTEDGAVVKCESGDKKIDVDSPVSMNMWGLRPDFFTILENGFVEFLENVDATDLKAEYLLPTIIGGLLEEKKLSVRVLQSKDKWFGVTYKEDKVDVVNAINNLIETGVYPNKLF